MLVVNKILVSRDFSDVSDRVLYHGIALAAKMKARLYVLHVADQQDGPYPGRDLPAVRAELRQAGAISEEALESVVIEGVTRQGDNVADTVCQYADEQGIDLIALGTHGRRGLQRILLGSVAEAVIRRAGCPVLTVRGEGTSDVEASSQIERILVPVDFSEYAREASRVAMEWAKLHDAQVDLLHVVTEDSLSPLASKRESQSLDEDDPRPKTRARRALMRIGREVGALNVPIKVHVRTGRPASTIVEFVEACDTDFLITSTHGRTGLQRFLLGSVAETVVRSVPCPVLTVKAFGRSIRALAS